MKQHKQPYLVVGITKPQVMCASRSQGIPLAWVTGTYWNHWLLLFSRPLCLFKKLRQLPLVHQGVIFQNSDRLSCKGWEIEQAAICRSAFGTRK